MTESSIPELPPDYHTHNLLCKHARGTPMDYARHAQHNGVREIACTDHCPTDDGFGSGHRMSLEQFALYREQVEAAREASRHVKVLLGVEADYYPGCERFLRPFTSAHPFDVVLGSVHFLDYWQDPVYGRGLLDEKDPVGLWRRYFDRMGELADSDLYDVICHIDLPKRFGNPIARSSMREIVLPALDRIAAAGLCIEINTSGLLHPMKEFYPKPDILAWASERGIGLTFGSDAHSPDRVGDGFVAALRLAREAGFTHYQRFARRQRLAVPL